MSLGIVRAVVAMRCFAVCAILALACAPFARAQSSSLEGVVQDSTGAAIPGAKVELQAKSYSAQTVTDESGMFSFARIPENSGTVADHSQGISADRSAMDCNRGRSCARHSRPQASRGEPAGHRDGGAHRDAPQRFSGQRHRAHAAGSARNSRAHARRRVAPGSRLQHVSPLQQPHRESHHARRFAARPWQRKRIEPRARFGRWRSAQRSLRLLGLLGSRPRGIDRQYRGRAGRGVEPLWQRGAFRRRPILDASAHARRPFDRRFLRQPEHARSFALGRRRKRRLVLHVRRRGLSHRRLLFGPCRRSRHHRHDGKFRARHRRPHHRPQVRLERRNLRARFVFRRFAQQWHPVPDEQHSSGPGRPRRQSQSRKYRFRHPAFLRRFRDVPSGLFLSSRQSRQRNAHRQANGAITRNRSLGGVDSLGRCAPDSRRRRRRT